MIGRLLSTGLATALFGLVGCQQPLHTPAPLQPSLTSADRADARAAVAATDGPTAKLRLMETTDLHVYMEAFDYYQNAPTLDSGLVRTATLMRRTRAEVTNSMLFDNGDILQGSPLGDWFVKDRDPKVDEHTVYKAMNLLGYDAANIGNHDFNYGLPFLQESLTGAQFPYISANVLTDDGPTGQHKPVFTPYVILNKSIVMDDGTTDIIKVGVIGFAPPQIMNWDRANLLGKVTAPDMVDIATKLIPQMKAEGADIIVAVPHSGISDAPRVGGEENASYYLAGLPGIDVILCGHSHLVFPGPDYADISDTDMTGGLLRGLPTVMAGFWGSHVGVVDLQLKKTADGWGIVSGTGAAREVKTSIATTDFEQDVRTAIAADHQSTLTYLEQPVGTTTEAIDSYFSEIVPTQAVQIVADAQTWYAKQIIAAGGADATAIGNGTLPILSASAPLNAGANPSAYTDVPTGPLSLRNVADMYVYPNQVIFVKVTGAQVIEWLEMAAQVFNQITPNSTAAQQLASMTVPAYTFDVLYGLSYDIDVSQPSRYNRSGALINPNSHRITNLTYNGAAIDPTQQFIVVTNDYRANGGGNFPGLNGSTVVLNPSKLSRDALSDYVLAIGGTINAPVNQLWHILPVAGATGVVFESGQGGKAHVADTGGLAAYLTEDATSGFSEYQITWPAAAAH